MLVGLNGTCGGSGSNRVSPGLGWGSNEAAVQEVILRELTASLRSFLEPKRQIGLEHAAPFDSVDKRPASRKRSGRFNSTMKSFASVSCETYGLERGRFYKRWPACTASGDPNSLRWNKPKTNTTKSQGIGLSSHRADFLSVLFRFTLKTQQPNVKAESSSPSSGLFFFLTDFCHVLN